ncbi:LacI family DNA-binding transcriptional regulator [Bacillus sp. SD088]|nr:LacI family DNA-binding transcriptional regulator [Bacillus sp. SD088]
MDKDLFVEGEILLATIRDVARLANVSVATVSRVINQNGYVHKDTESKVRKSMELLNYKPNSVARALANKRTDSLALIVPDITNPFFPELAKAIEDTARGFGYSLILTSPEFNADSNNNYLENLINRYIDGIICSSSEIPEADITQLQKVGIPIVALDRAVNSKGITSISVNNYDGGMKATQHLLSIGCKRIAHISGPLHVNTSLARYRGYVDTLDSAQLFDPSLIREGDFTIESGINNTYALLEKHPDIDGIFTANDLMAVGALKALIRLEKRIPEDIALIGFDGISLGTAVEPEISTIAQSIYEIGSLAVKKLISQINNKQDTEELSQELEVQLVQRATTLRKA